MDRVPKWQQLTSQHPEFYAVNTPNRQNVAIMSLGVLRAVENASAVVVLACQFLVVQAFVTGKLESNLQQEQKSVTPTTAAVAPPGSRQTTARRFYDVIKRKSKYHFWFNAVNTPVRDGF